MSCVPAGRGGRGADTCKERVRKGDAMNRIATLCGRTGLPPEKVIEELGGKIFYIKHPNTGAWVWCCQLTGEEVMAMRKEYSHRHRRMVEFMLAGPQNVLQGILWWLMVPFLPIVMLIEAFKPTMEQVGVMAERRSYVGGYVGDDGDSIFDHVNSVRKADLEFLLGGVK